MKKINRIKFLFLLAIALGFSGFVFADTECIGEDCSIGVSLNVQGIPAFNGTVRNLTGSPLSGVNVSVSGTNYSNLTSGGIYGISGGLSGFYSLTAAKDGYLNQTKSNQLAVLGETRIVNFNIGQLGEIKGNMLNFSTSVGINNVNVSLFLYDEFLSSTLTNSTGYYEFNDLAPGYYDMNVTATGYNSNSKPNNHVLGGANTTVNFWLW